MKEKKDKEIKDCCGPKKKYEGNNPFKGFLYGLIPHIGCILFVIAAVLGSTVLMTFFKPVLMNRNIFYYLILISIGFATISSFFYMRKNNALSWKGVKAKRSYLIIMYATTVGINLILFFLIFPMTANISGNSVNVDGLDSVLMEVKIPCPGHAPLITSELKTIEGVAKTEYNFPNKFTVYYDSSQTSIKEILKLDVFSEYPATITGNQILDPVPVTGKSIAASSGESCSGGCGGTSGCGGGCGSPTCEYN